MKLTKALIDEMARGVLATSESPEEHEMLTELFHLAALGLERDGSRGLITFNTVEYEWDTYDRSQLQWPYAAAALGVVEFFREARIFHLKNQAWVATQIKEVCTPQAQEESLDAALLSVGYSMSKVGTKYHITRLRDGVMVGAVNTDDDVWAFVRWKR
jgi:hypothetical protein